MKLSKLILGGLLLSAINSQAGLIIYDDRSAWETAIGSLGGAVDGTVDFNGFVSDTSFATSAVDFGLFSLEQTAGPDQGGNKVDVTPFDFGLNVNGTPMAAIWAFDAQEVTMTFDDPVLGFGGDIKTFADLFLNVDLNTGDFAEWDHVGGTGFLGIAVMAPSEAFTSAVFSDGGASTQTWGWDDISTGSASVPESGYSLSLLAFGFASIGVVARRIKRQRV